MLPLPPASVHRTVVNCNQGMAETTHANSFTVAQATPHHCQLTGGSSFQAALRGGQLTRAMSAYHHAVVNDCGDMLETRECHQTLRRTGSLA